MENSLPSSRLSRNLLSQVILFYLKYNLEFKENVSFLVHDDEHKERRIDGRKAKHADVCGVWDIKLGKVVNSIFSKDENNTIKFVVLHAHKYCIKKVVKGETRGNRAAALIREYYRVMPILLHSEARRNV